ncbi:MAG: hypothetical protein KGM17_13485 [Sphingomonadales bacterium]|nr:hypothetical protein [Sphingomonadales bacterium]
MSRAAEPPSTLILIAAIAALVGWIAPFDVFYTALAGGSPMARALVIAAVAVIGGLAARGAGLRLRGHGPGGPVAVGLLAAALVAGWVVLLDCFVFRGRLDPEIVAFLRKPLGVRLSYFMLRAYNENVLYRLFAFGCAAWAWQRWRGRRGTLPQLLGLAALVQMVNIGANVVLRSGMPVTVAGLGYDALRYIVPGVVWAGLFVRNGFVAAEVASVGCHLFLQPAFSLLLDR